MKPNLEIGWVFCFIEFLFRVSNYIYCTMYISIKKSSCQFNLLKMVYN